MKKFKQFLEEKNILYFLGKLLIVGVFMYFGITSILEPNTYSNLIPDFLNNLTTPENIVMMHGIIEIICSLLILFGLGAFWPYLVLILSFLGVLFSVSGTTLVRDLGILGGLLLLTHIYLKKR